MCCTGHRIQFNSGPPQKTEVLLAQLVEHHTFNVGVTSSSLVGDTFLIVMGLFLVLISYELVRKHVVVRLKILNKYKRH